MKSSPLFQVSVIQMITVGDNNVWVVEETCFAFVSVVLKTLLFTAGHIIVIEIWNTNNYLIWPLRIKYITFQVFNRNHAKLTAFQKTLQNFFFNNSAYQTVSNASFTSSNICLRPCNCCDLSSVLCPDMSPRVWNLLNFRKKLCRSCAIVLHSTSRICDFCLFLPASAHTTAFKQTRH